MALVVKRMLKSVRYKLTANASSETSHICWFLEPTLGVRRNGFGSEQFLVRQPSLPLNTFHAHRSEALGFVHDINIAKTSSDGVGRGICKAQHLSLGLEGTERIIRGSST